jgi:hypothetical protein
MIGDACSVSVMYSQQMLPPILMGSAHRHMPPAAYNIYLTPTRQMQGTNDERSGWLFTRARLYFGFYGYSSYSLSDYHVHAFSRLPLVRVSMEDHPVSEGMYLTAISFVFSSFV